MHRFRPRLTYANVMVTVLAFIVLGGGTALAAFVVSSNSQVGPGTISGHRPPSGKHANIIAGSVNGKDVAANSLTSANIREASLTGNVRKLVYNAAALSSSPHKTIATVGPYTIKGECTVDEAGFVRVRLYAHGPAGTADYMYDETENDNKAIGTTSNGVLIPANTDFQIVATFGENALGPKSFRRIAGTAILKSGSVLVQVDFNAVADGRGSGGCFIYGTATRAT